MLKIAIEGSHGEFEFEGTDYEMAVEAGVMLHQLVRHLRKSGRSDEFIRGVFDIVMRKENE